MANATTTTTGQNTPVAGTTFRKYMWLITVQWPVGGGGFGNATFSNTADIAVGASRMEVCSQILDLAKRETGSNSLNVLFFALEPDQII
ncbi:hypothetical protein ABZ912_08950 [Nonomuraea angiospora]|uniref:hypothetical protein n=1 Tax=Nonomuraea angiospora TaxID=46172 RepID=UPI0033EA9DE2